MSFLQSAPFEIRQMIFNELLKNDIEMNILLLKHMYKAQNSINDNQEYIHVDIIKL